MPTPLPPRTDRELAVRPSVLAAHVLADPAAYLFGPDAIALLAAIAERPTDEAAPAEMALLRHALVACISAAILRIREGRP